MSNFKIPTIFNCFKLKLDFSWNVSFPALARLGQMWRQEILVGVDHRPDRWPTYRRPDCRPDRNSDRRPDRRCPDRRLRIFSKNGSSMISALKFLNVDWLIKCNNFDWLNSFGKVNLLILKHFLSKNKKMFLSIGAFFSIYLNWSVWIPIAKMAKFAAIISFVVFLHFCKSSTIVEIQTKTGDDLFAGMGINGKISLDICAIVNVQFGGQEISCCQVLSFK